MFDGASLVTINPWGSSNKMLGITRTPRSLISAINQCFKTALRAPSELDVAPSEANVSINLKESLQMVAGVTWFRQSFAWIIRRNFAWMPWWSNFAASWEALHISSLLEMYASINWKMSWVPWFSEISADGCISAVAFNAAFGKLICFVEVTGSNANNVKAWRETIGVEDSWTFTAREWTQHDNPPKGQIVEKGMRTDEKLVGLPSASVHFEVLSCLRLDPWVLCWNTLNHVWQELQF